MTRSDPQHETEWYSGNLTGVPTTLIASPEFNRSGTRLAIHGTRETQKQLFARLDGCTDQAAATAVFEDHMAMQFGQDSPQDNQPRRYATSYLELLRGWGFDSNGPHGAVLKGWVESRFGLIPTWHKEKLGRFPSQGWVAYLEEKACSRFHNNAINFQLDALYEFCQWAIARFQAPDSHHLPLWRGTNSVEEQVVAGSLKERHCTLRLNNLVSFSASEQRAEEFGDWILQTEVPHSKIVFFPGLLSDPVLNSESEYIVIGGNYSVRAWHGYL